MIIRFFRILISVLKSCFAGTHPGRNTLLLHLSPRIPSLTFNKVFYSRRGYTLIELILVLVLLGLMFGITVPKFRQALAHDSLDATAMRLIGLVQNLREKAVADQVSYILSFDIQNKKIWAIAGNATEEERESARQKAFRLPPDVRIQDIWSWKSGKFYNEGSIRLTSKGYVEQSIIHLQSEDGREVSLELTPFLGSIKIHEGYVDFDRG